MQHEAGKQTANSRWWPWIASSGYKQEGRRTWACVLRLLLSCLGHSIKKYKKLFLVGQLDEFEKPPKQQNISIMSVFWSNWKMTFCPPSTIRTAATQEVMTSANRLLCFILKWMKGAVFSTRVFALVQSGCWIKITRALQREQLVLDEFRNYWQQKWSWTNTDRAKFDLMANFETIALFLEW